jgi:hypothetical protein
MFRKVINGEELDGIFEGTTYAKINGVNLTISELASLNIYPVVEPYYDAVTQITSDWYFDSSRNVVTKEVIEFEKGILNKWYANKFVNGVLFRKWRVRVRWIDTLTGGLLEQKSNEDVRVIGETQ